MTQDRKQDIFHKDRWKFVQIHNNDDYDDDDDNQDIEQRMTLVLIELSVEMCLCWLMESSYISSQVQATNLIFWKRTKNAQQKRKMFDIEKVSSSWSLCL